MKSYLHHAKSNCHLTLPPVFWDPPPPLLLSGSPKRWSSHGFHGFLFPSKHPCYRHHHRLHTCTALSLAKSAITLEAPCSTSSQQHCRVLQARPPFVGSTAPCYAPRHGADTQPQLACILHKEQECHLTVSTMCWWVLHHPQRCLCYCDMHLSVGQTERTKPPSTSAHPPPPKQCQLTAEKNREGGGGAPADDATAAPVQLINDVKHITAGGLQTQLAQEPVDISMGQHPPPTCIHLSQPPQVMTIAVAGSATWRGATAILEIVMARLAGGSSGGVWCWWCQHQHKESLQQTGQKIADATMRNMSVLQAPAQVLEWYAQLCVACGGFACLLEVVSD